MKQADRPGKTLNFEVEGRNRLSGSVTINTSKNGAVALLCASLVNKNVTTLVGMPKIEEVHRIIEVLQSIGLKVEWSGRSVIITPPKKLSLQKINKKAARVTRSILMFVGPLIHHTKKFSIPQSGGCELGSRTVRPHFYALEKLGINIDVKKDSYDVSHKRLTANEIIMYESGDTPTINAILAASLIPEATTIKYASANYQVQEICFFLEKAGVKINGVGTTTLTVHGVKSIDRPITYNIGEDPSDAMFFLTVAILTKSEILLERCPINFLEMELLVLEKMGFKYDIVKRYLSKNKKTNLVDIKTKSSVLNAPLDKVHSRPYPGLNADNLPFFVVIATIAKGRTLIHDWMYEKRALYYTELDKLGAQTELVDPHRIFVTGPSELKATEIVCPPALRPATIILIAMLAAKGKSTLRNIYSISRGYEDLAKRLSTLGAKIHIKT